MYIYPDLGSKVGFAAELGLTAAHGGCFLQIQDCDKL